MSTIKRKEKPQIRFRIDDGWYDVSNWGKYHPGGAKILEQFDGEDATDAFYSIHSKEAISQLQHMKAEPLAENDGERTELQKNFRALIDDLTKDGWFERNIWAEIGLIGIILTLFITGMIIAKSFPLVAIVFMGLAMQQAGWLGHSFTHGRSPGCYWPAVLLSCLINGFSSKWWAKKHCTHHALPNYVDVDPDIQLSPVFYLTAPDPSDDSYFRRFQHIYALPAYSLLYFSWRHQSLVHAWSIDDNAVEMILITIHYSFMFTLVPYWVFLGAVAFGGFCVALVVTANHQSEEFYSLDVKGSYDFVTAQFTTTRNAYNHTWLARWFWGGMDTQLEHHLFPFMPQYYYHSLVPIVQEFAKKNNLEYRTEPAWDLLVRNVRTMKRVASAAAEKQNKFTG